LLHVSKLAKQQVVTRQ